MVNFADVEAALATVDSSEIVQEAARTSVALSGFNRQTMAAGKIRTPLVKMLPTAGWESGDLGSTTRRKNVSDWKLSPKMLVAQPLSTVIPLPEEVLDDSKYDIWGAIKTGVSTVFGQMLDAAVLFGKNKPAAWTDKSVFDMAVDAGNYLVENKPTGTDIATDLNDAFALVEDDGYDVNAVLARRSLQSKLRGLRASTGEPVFVSALRDAPNSVDSIFGVPFRKVTNGAWDKTKATAIVGDMSHIQIGVRKDMAFKILDQATLESNGTTIHLGQEDALALRVTFRVAYAVFDPVNPEAADGCPFAVIAPTDPKPSDGIDDN